MTLELQINPKPIEEDDPLQGKMSPKDDLPHDVIFDILSRLPVKTLIRFRCVSKSWYSTISNPNFITTHLNRPCSYDNGDYLQYIKKMPSEQQKWCFLYDQTYVNRVELELPFNSQSDCSIVGSCNGLICLSELSEFGSIIYLWNPSIRKFKTLPSSSIGCSNFVVLGFGFHSQSNDYKVVKITYFRDGGWRSIENLPPQAEVYTLSTDSWRKIEIEVPFFTKCRERGAFVNGSVHWLACTSDLKVHQSNDMIMSFDMGDEVFREMKLPNYSIDGVVPFSMSLAVLKESLSLHVCFRFADNDWRGGQSYIWVMREYGVVESWTKQFTFVLQDGRVERPLGFTKNNELLLETRNRDLYFFDPESLQLTHHGTFGGPSTTNVATFMETLVLLDLGDALLGQKN